MLRLYKPIEHEIFELHDMLEHLVCTIWCEASDDPWDTNLTEEFKELLPYNISKGKLLEDEVKRIYGIFKGLTTDQKIKIKNAFYRTNQIEQLCNKDIEPVYLSEMDKVVVDDIKPIFKWCYEKLLDKAKVKGDKLEYYKELIAKNKFQYCPCCGLIDFESTAPENEIREANDHYLPKSEYPFASVNFQNLVPLCYKCNSDRKKTKDPIENHRKAFYPFAKEDHEISISIDIDPTKDLDYLVRGDLKVQLDGDSEKISTWDWLFDISDRYNDKVRQRIKSFIRQLKSRYRQQKKDNAALSFDEIIEREIELYEEDKYSDWKFLKIPLLQELKNRADLMEVYN